jgi:hypothetical protein
MIHAPKIRNYLVEIIGNLPSDGLSTATIISQLKTLHPDAIKDEQADLIEAALTRIVSQIGARHSNATVNIEPDLFGKYGLPPTLYVTVITDSGPEKRMKNVQDITLEESERLVAENSTPRTRTPERIKRMAKLVKDLRASGAKPDQKIGDWWASKQAKEGSLVPTP